jgi:hypothetical protein
MARPCHSQFQDVLVYACQPIFRDFTSEAREKFNVPQDKIVCKQAGND